MPTVNVDPVLEAIARKLHGIDQVLQKHRARMIKAAAKAGRDAMLKEMAKGRRWGKTIQSAPPEVQETMRQMEAHEDMVDAHGNVYWTNKPREENPK